MTKRPLTLPNSTLPHGTPPAPAKTLGDPLHQALAAVSRMQHDLTLAPCMPTSSMVTRAAARHGLTATAVVAIYVIMLETYQAESLDIVPA